MKHPGHLVERFAPRGSAQPSKQETLRRLGDGSGTRRIHQAGLSGYFLNIGVGDGDAPESQTEFCVNRSACFISAAVDWPSRTPSNHGPEGCCI